MTGSVEKIKTKSSSMNGATQLDYVQERTWASRVKSSAQDGLKFYSTHLLNGKIAHTKFTNALNYA